MASQWVVLLPPLYPLDWPRSYHADRHSRDRDPPPSSRPDPDRYPAQGCAASSGGRGLPLFQQPARTSGPLMHESLMHESRVRHGIPLEYLPTRAAPLGCDISPRNRGPTPSPSVSGRGPKRCSRGQGRLAVTTSSVSYPVMPSDPYVATVRSRSARRERLRSSGDEETPPIREHRAGAQNR